MKEEKSMEYIIKGERKTQKTNKNDFFLSFFSRWSFSKYKNCEGCRKGKKK